MAAQAADPVLLKAFFVESADIIERLETDIDSLHDDANDETINSIFRGIHTIKGNSSFLDLEVVTRLAHKAETLLDKVRKHEVTLDTEILSLCRTVTEDLKVLIIEQQLDHDTQGTLAALEQKLNQKNGPPSGASVTPTPAPAVKPNEKAPTAGRAVVSSGVVRVDESRFQKIINLVSELELYRNSLELVPEKLETLGEQGAEIRFELDLVASKIAHLTRSLSSLVLGAKLVPVNQVFLRFPRVVRELAQRLGKEIALEIKNGDAELDKSIVDAIADPMTHLIRNSADHGIETKDERVKRGKSPGGKIVLNSYVRGNFVFIEISDDGRGIDPEKIVAKAVEKGILPAEKAGTLTEAQKLGLIFAPGFSTAEKVTDISGRGVGMDVVKSNINRLKGSVLINSRVGFGTVIQLRFPMSMMVMFSLFVDVNNSACAIPLDQVEESCDYRRTEWLTELPKREPDKHMTLYSLSELLWGKPLDEQATAFHVLRFKGNDQVGFIVDEFLSIEEALVQSVDSYIAALPGVQGSTIRKDGTVSLVLNVDAISVLAQKAKPVAFVRKRDKAELDQAKLEAYFTQAA